MPRLYRIELSEDHQNLTINEFDSETDEFVDRLHDTDVIRFCEQNNVEMNRADSKKRGKKITGLDVEIADDDIFEPYKLTVDLYTKDDIIMVNSITYTEK